MKNFIWGLALIGFGAVSACAGSKFDLVPALELRTLRISPDFAGLEYQYEVCAQETLWWCSQKKMQKDTYDLTKKDVREKLINMGFVAKVREKI